MATRKRNEWLDDPASDEDDIAAGYSSAEEGRGKALAGRQTKRRKVDADDSDSEDDFSDVGRVVNDPDDRVRLHGPLNTERTTSASPEEDGLDLANASQEEAPPENQDEDNNDNDIPPSTAARPPTKLQRTLAKAANTAKKSGVVYLSRIPPFMKPQTVKHLLAPHAPSGLGRIFLTPEGAEMRKQRLRQGGNKKHNFVDGWVEFTSKREAKSAVEMLNARIIGGKKGGYYYDDVWNLKYLRGFKWRHLTEQIANENAERTARIRVEDRRERKEQKDFLRNVERSKMLEGMEKKKAAKLEAGEGGVSEKPSKRKDGEDEPKARNTHHREFTQTAVKSKGRGKEAPRPSEDVRKVLSKIF